jgi:type IV pilus assembly protein PilM
LKKEEGVKSVRVSLPEGQIYLFKLKLDKGGLEHVREAIELSLEEHIPIPAQDAIFDYEILSQDDQYLFIQVTAIPKGVLENYLVVFRNADIWVKSFELEGQAIARAIIKKGDPGTYMIVDFGEKSTGISILTNGVVMFTSTLDVGGMTLNNMISKNFKVTMEEAEKMKKEYGLQRNMSNKEIFPVLLNSVSILRDEIAKHFLYWNTHKEETGREVPKIEKVYLCGGDSNLVGLAEYFSISLKTKVEMANVWVNVMDTTKYVPDVNSKEALSFAAALGLALGDFEND